MRHARWPCPRPPVRSDRPPERAIDAPVGHHGGAGASSTRLNAADRSGRRSAGRRSGPLPGSLRGPRSRVEIPPFTPDTELDVGLPEGLLQLLDLGLQLILTTRGRTARLVTTRKGLAAPFEELPLPLRVRRLRHLQSAARLHLGHLTTQRREDDRELLVRCLEGPASHVARFASDQVEVASPSIWFALFFLLLRRVIGTDRAHTDRELEIEVVVLRHQLKVLSRKGGRPRLHRIDKVFLAACSRALPKQRWGSFVVAPSTLLRWHRELVARKWTHKRKKIGRPPIDPALASLICRMARENPRWGYMRIKGECQKLGISVSATTVKKVLRAAGLDPAPRRDGPSLSEFLRAQASGIVACDFFSVETVFLHTLYVLFFIEHGSRRLHITSSTRHPSG